MRLQTGTSADLQTLREAVSGFGGFKKLVRLGVGLKKNAPETEPQDVCSLTQKDVQFFVFSRIRDNCFAWSLGDCAFAVDIPDGQLFLNAQVKTIGHSACGEASQKDSIEQEQVAPLEVYVVRKGSLASAFQVNIKAAETLSKELADHPASMMLTLKSGNRSFDDHLKNIGQTAYRFLIRVAGGASGQADASAHALRHHQTSAERGTLRHLSIADSPVSSVGLQSALSALDHCLRTLELSPGIIFLAEPESPLVAGNYACASVRTLVLGDALEAAGARELRKRKKPALPGRLPVTIFPFEPLQTLWLVGLGGLTEDDVIGIFRRTPLLEEFRLFPSGSQVYRHHSGDIEVAAGHGSYASLTPAAVAGVFKGLTRHHCPRLARLSIGWKHNLIGHQELIGSWLRRFADAHPEMTEVKLFLTERFHPDDWLYALSNWAPTLEKVTGHFGAYSGDLDAERQLVLLAKAPRLTELECLGRCYRDEVQWMREQQLGAFTKLKRVGHSSLRCFRWNKYTWLLDDLRYPSWRRE
ncbi:hypothetical protein KFL_002450050 [Klebsormidium nitens]|uniref:Uncharacterized protein n=1 Tax=Klebsormidium nitens TaxID=105231 RepID=A0A1Y1I540_KLENI|nr:hypothetical protein KFL_002450050 [Klebsormidium nitens]|eukprot:GAQ85613.1 hypothetical protein KFL_002450050 [Klebsormidium nitens]